MNNYKKPQAFISCSIREEDSRFNNIVMDICRKCGFEPMGTVGKIYTSPEAIYKSMDKKIKEADCLVVAATPRYLQKDIGNNGEQLSISENIHTEIGMASSIGLPILAFIQKGTNVGNFLPGITQYIELDLDNPRDLINKIDRINDYFKNAREKIEVNRKRNSTGALFAVLGVGAIAYAGFKILQSFFSSDEEEIEEYESYEEEDNID